MDTPADIKPQKTTVGTHNLALGNHLFGLALHATLPEYKKSPEQLAGLASLFTESKVTSPVEAMLVSQMASLHANAMRLMATAMECNSASTSNAMYAQANKLMRSFALHVETYEKLKRGGQQRIKVDHVHVHEGGQAIVGNIHQPAKGV